MNGKISSLRIHRHLAGLSQRELAERIGRSQPWIHRAELGKNGAAVSPDDAAALANALQTPIEKLLHKDSDR